MAKQVLGRSLANLLGPKRPVGSGLGLKSEATERVELSRGFETLLAGTKADQVRSPGAVGAQAKKPEATGLRRALPFYCFGVDLVLLAVSAVIVLNGWGGGAGVAAAGVFIAVGSVAASIPFVMQGAVGGNEDPEWFVIRPQGESRKDTYIVHLTSPIFIGRIAKGDGPEPSVVPLWIEGRSDSTPPEKLMQDLSKIAPATLPALKRESRALSSVLTRL